MKKTSYILFILWLSTVVLSNALLTCKSFYDNSSLELTEKESKEQSSDDSDNTNDTNNDNDTDEDTEKKSEDKSESKSEKELFAYKSLDTLPSEILAALSAKSQIPSNDEDFVSSLYVILPENPPEL